MASSSMYYVLILIVLATVAMARNVAELEVVGPCVNNLCPHTYNCARDECVREKPKARPGTVSIGPCINTQCPVGHICIGGENQCYPA